MALTFFFNKSIHYFVIFLMFVNETISYEKILLEDSRLCPLKPGSDRVSVTIGKEKSSSKIVTQETYFANWTGKYSFNCRFSVRAPDDYGLYAVIQVLNFRISETPDRCKDYVHFDAPQNFVSKVLRPEKHEKKICGRIYAGQTYAPKSDSRIVSRNGFVASRGRIDVTIYLAPEKLSKYEKLEMQIAFTAYKKSMHWNDCYKKDKYIQCAQCELIWDGLAGDDVQNCPYTSCLDEDGCKELESPFEVYNIVSNETGTKITAVVMSAIMAVLFLFSLCLCACRRSQRCCWQLPPTNTVRVEMNRSHPNAGEEFATTFHEMPTDAFRPSAPSPDDMKDPPPSYESLFPSK